MHPETLAIHAGQGVDPATGAVIPPIHLSTTFERAGDGEYPSGYIYTRIANPNRTALEAALTALEGGAACAAFGSGQAAAWAIFMALRPGDHVVAPDDAYHGITRLLRETMAPWGLRFSQVDMADPANVRAAITPQTRLIWAETPSNPLLKIADITAVAEVARTAGALLAVDNTWGTPALQNPLALGADLVLHSTTKYLGGHSDALGGAVIAREDDAFVAQLRHIQSNGGAVPSPFDCWLILRGMRSLAYRMRGHCENAAKVAAFLAEQPQIARVNYPGLPSHPDHSVAARQMRGFGGMLSVEVEGGQAAALAVCARLTLFTRATSLGGTESLIEHRASVEGPESRTPPGLLRISVGLEHADDLIDDLRQALESSK